MKKHKWEDIELAVQCCTSHSAEWEETCGKCPFNIRAADQIEDAAKCIDELILALFNEVQRLRVPEQVKQQGYDYYITDSLGGVHTDGVGYAPDGTFCGECTRRSCEGCWTEEDMMWNRRED